MRLLDRLALNRLVAIILSFILSIIKIIAPKVGKELEDNHPIPPLPKPPIRKRRFPWFPRNTGETNE